VYALVRAFGFVQVFYQFWKLFVSSWFTSTEAPMELAKPIGPCLALDLVYSRFIYFEWLVIDPVTAGIGPAIATIIITKSTQDPTGGK
jgi:hypothetical protein